MGRRIDFLYVGSLACLDWRVIFCANSYECAQEGEYGGKQNPGARDLRDAPIRALGRISRDLLLLFLPFAIFVARTLGH